MGFGGKLTRPLRHAGRKIRGAVGLYKKPEEIATMPVAAPELGLSNPEGEVMNEETAENDKKKRRKGKSALKVDSAGGTGLDIGSGGSGRNIV